MKNRLDSDRIRLHRAQEKLRRAKAQYHKVRYSVLRYSAKYEAKIRVIRLTQLVEKLSALASAEQSTEKIDPKGTEDRDLSSDQEEPQSPRDQ